MAPGVGVRLFHRLLRYFGSPEKVFRASHRELTSVEGIGAKTADEIIKLDVVGRADREFRLLDNLGARVLTLESPEYPALLKSIYDPPPVLYCMGKKLNEFPVCLAIVGTRQLTSYGKTVAEELSKRLAQRGICIVSGMARGIDTIAHRAALQAGGSTLAVFGNGLAHTYPPENFKLRKEIAENGAVLSEFPMSMKPDRNNFPARNRLISGLSYGALVVEAGEKSGALITAHFALEQGRDVFSVPGKINSKASVGCNRLIKMGAKLVDGPDAILEELPPSALALLKPEALEIPTKDLSEKEKILVALLAEDEKHIDFLIENSSLTPAEVSATLVQLELKGRISQRDGKMFYVAYSS